jgi:Flp pilus assembly protein TadG
MRRFRDESGQAMVEFALIIPVMLLVLLAIASFAQVWEQKAALNDAIRAETRQASVCRFSTASSPTPQQVFMSTAGSSLSGVTAPTPSYGAGCTVGTQVTVTGSYPWSISILGVSFGSGNLTVTAVGVVQ